MRVMKFGGTSVKDADRIRIAASLVQEAHRSSPVCVVVSALGGVTDQLEETALQCACGEHALRERCAALSERHLEAAQQLASSNDLDALRETIGSRFEELEKVLEGIALVGECSSRTMNKVLSVGELLSAALLAAAIRQRGLPAEACDARSIIVTDERFGAARVRTKRSYDKIRRLFVDNDVIQVVTGFLASTERGETTTLGRGGSDYTASLLGAALSAERIEIWTDVDGVLSADPRQVPGAFSLDKLSYDELLELSHFGAKVVYPPTVHPARRESVPLVIRNTFNPSFPGTTVVDSVAGDSHPIRGISAIPSVALLRLQGDGMSEVPGAARRLFKALARADVNVILISQASSEHSICLAVEPDKAQLATSNIHEEFEWERGAGLIDDLIVDENLSIVAVVGAGMSHRPGISGRVFGALGAAGINVRAIAQGSSELNISFAISSAEEGRALRTLHAAFFEKPRVHLFLAGVGGVGSDLLRQFRDRTPPEEWSLSGVSNSQRMSIDRDRRDASRWQREILDDPACVQNNLEAWKSSILGTSGQRVLIDCSASDELESIYAELLRAGVSIVTANKKPVASDGATWGAIRSAIEEGPGRLFLEATVGAGLPIVRTLQDQLETGDRVLELAGMFSGTLGYLMSELRKGRSFSEAVREAHALGYTEPDPRQDLSGMDVARKLLILARLGGADMELADLEVVSLLPEGWDELPIEEFWDHLAELDDVFSSHLREAVDSGKTLTFLAHWDESGGHVGLEQIDTDHPCATVTGTDNLFLLTTERYRDSPLVIRGPGAGPEVTAAGVYADLLHALAEGDSS